MQAEKNLNKPTGKTPNKPFSVPSEPITIAQSESYTLSSFKRALKGILKQNGMEYFTDSQGRRYWVQPTYQFLEVSADGEILD